MKKFFTAKWPIWAASLGIAMLFLIAVYLIDAPIGMTDGYIMISRFCTEYGGNVSDILHTIPWDWQTGFILGMLIGGIIAATATGKWEFNFFPEDRNSKKFLPALLITVIEGIGGGFLVMTGLQLAGDSFIGQWAGAMQLSTGAWIFIGGIFVVATFCRLLITGKLKL